MLDSHFPFPRLSQVRTDVESSTALWEANPHAMQDALDLHSKILRECSNRYNGYEIGTGAFNNIYFAQ